jgi:hypothetical protein
VLYLKEQHIYLSIIGSEMAEQIKESKTMKRANDFTKAFKEQLNKEIKKLK